MAYGAAAKGNTLINFAGVRPDLLRFVVDRSPAKQGKYMPGSRIPIVDEKTSAARATRLCVHPAVEPERRDRAATGLHPRLGRALRDRRAASWSWHDPAHSVHSKPSITELEVGYATDAARHGWGDRCYEYIHRFENAVQGASGRSPCDRNVELHRCAAHGPGRAGHRPRRRSDPCRHQLDRQRRARHPPRRQTGVRRYPAR